MRRLRVLVLLALSGPSLAGDQARTAQATTPAVRYGANPAAGRTFTHDGIKFYYEVYGAGEPLLLMHGNGGSIADLGAQIAHFRKRYKVIAMDSRDQGRSDDSPDKLTYEKMTDDLAALVDHLKVGPVNVLGWSDGGIEALLLGIRAHLAEEWWGGEGFARWTARVVGAPVSETRFIVVNSVAAPLFVAGTVLAITRPWWAWFAVTFSTIVVINGLLHQHAPEAGARRLWHHRVAAARGLGAVVRPTIYSATVQRTHVKRGTVKPSRLVVVGLACFAVGALVQAVFAQAKKPTFSTDLFKGKEAKEAATALLDGALQLAEAGSWERIAVGRAWYLGGDKAKGQEIFDLVTGGKKVEDSDWFRVGRVYAEAGEWDKAQARARHLLRSRQGDRQAVHRALCAPLDVGSRRNCPSPAVR